MARRPALFKQHDVKRAVRGAIAGGVEILRVEIEPNGKIVLIACNKRTSDDDEIDRDIAALEARLRQRQAKNKG